MRIFKRILVGLIVILVLVVAGFVIWASGAAGPLPEAAAVMQSDAQVSYQEVQGWFVFQPTAAPAETGLILYPGGKVEPRSYAPTARAIAEQGYLVVIVPMPLNLAVFDPNRAAEVMAAYPNIQSWAVGGHSLGGAMAASFAYSRPELVDGLVLWASYPAEGNSLADRSLAVVSIYGTLDGLATLDKIEASRSLLPQNTRFVPIEGGNHAQFGWYGEQSGDNPAQISREAQQAQVVQATAALLEGLK